MKTHIAILAAVAVLAAVVTSNAQVAIPIEPVTVQQAVTVNQNVTLTEVPLTQIRFDLIAKRIDFQVASGTGNRTITLSGSAYEKIREGFLSPFSKEIAPLLRGKLQE